LEWVNDSHEFEPLPCLNKGKKALKKKRVNKDQKYDEDDNLVIFKSVKLAPRQSSINYLMFEDKSE
jgi:hypothetical protein